MLIYYSVSDSRWNRVLFVQLTGKYVYTHTVRMALQSKHKFGEILALHQVSETLAHVILGDDIFV